MPRPQTHLTFGVALLALSGLIALPAGATPQPYRPATVAAPVAGPVRADAQTTAVRSQIVDLPKGRSAVIDLPADAGDVFVSNPNVTDAVLRTPRRVFIMGVNPGVSDVLFFDGGGRQIMNLSVRVDASTDELADTVHRLFPNAHVDVQSLNGQVVLSGMAANDGQADQILRLASTFADKPEHVINLMSIAGKDQVTLKVRIVEVNRSTIKQLGLSTDYTWNFGSQSYSFSRGNGYGTNGSFYGSTGACYKQAGATTLNGTNTVTSTTPTTTGSVTTTVTNTGTSTYGATNNTCLAAFERVGLARTLAEPNLTTVSGETGKFLAGGEFPIPVDEDSQGHITVSFKPFGVGLGFTPVVMSSGLISLRVSTEVSELTNTGAYAVSANFTIPALSVRRAETTVEMPSGSSLMIAGLLQSKYKQTVDSLPGLTSLPVLGSLFRSRDFLSDETEMVVIVTPYIVSPTDPNAIQTPADNLQIAGDAATIFLGTLNKVIRAKTGAPATAPDSGPYQAPVGYVIE